jgi:cold shock CspA family protein
VKTSNRDIDDQHLSVQSIFDYFDSIGATEAAVDTSLLWLMEARLIEPYDSSIRELSPAQRVAISHSGVAHLRLATSNEVFVEQMAFTTGLRNEDAALKLREIYRARTDFSSRMAEARKTFVSEVLREDASLMGSAGNLEQYANQRALVERLNTVGGLVGDKAMHDLAGPAESETVVAERASAVVEWFNAEKGYAFLRSDEVEDRVFLAPDRLEEQGEEYLLEGDVVICDIIKNDRGLSVAKIYEIELQDSSQEMDCEVIRYWTDRSYGFARNVNGHQDVFFLLSIFGSEHPRRIGLGSRFRALVSTDASGRLRATRLVA